MLALWFVCYSVVKIVNVTSYLFNKKIKWTNLNAVNSGRV